MAFLDILPDPDTKILDSGTTQSNGTAGPGFASISVTSNDKVMMNKTNTGRVITRKLATQQWKLKISYNPLTRDEFEPVYNFLLYYGKLRPFYVRLPQHETARNSGILTPIIVDGAITAGAQFFMTDGWGSAYSKATLSSTNRPRPGDMFTFNDSSDSLHKKVYRVLRTEENGYLGQEWGGSSEPAAEHVKIWTYPNILRSVSDNTTITFVDPKMRVIMDKDVVQYSLNTNNLYKFDLQLTEALA